MIPLSREVRIRNGSQQAYVVSNSQLIYLGDLRRCALRLRFPVSRLSRDRFASSFLPVGSVF